MKALKNPTIHVLTFGQFRSPDLFTKALDQYAKDNAFDYKIFGHTWDDEIFDKNKVHSNIWDSLKVDNPKQVELKASIIESHERVINENPKDWQANVFPVIANLILMLNSLFEIIKHYSEIADVLKTPI